MENILYHKGLEFSGTESEYGMMVETVNGITPDYSVDGAYWSFKVNIIIQKLTSSILGKKDSASLLTSITAVIMFFGLFFGAFCSLPYLAIGSAGGGIRGGIIMAFNWGERFYKSDSSRGKDKKGTGLGLSIVREIITYSTCWIFPMSALTYITSSVRMSSMAKRNCAHGG